MTVVVIDTNAVHRDPWLGNEPGVALRGIAEAGDCKLIFPRVVIDELRRQQADWVSDNRAIVAKTIDKMRGGPIDVEATAQSLERSFDGLQAQIEASFEALLALSGVEVAEIPADITASLVTRDLAKHRPFLEVGSEPWSAGFRDAVIWETVLRTIENLEENERLIFVTADRGFLSEDKRSLHEHLLSDVVDVLNNPDQVISAKTTFLAQSEVEKLIKAEQAAVAEHAALVRVATDALFELDGQEVTEQLQYGGDYGHPSFVRFPLPAMDNGTIVAIDQDSEFVVERVSGAKATATAEVLVSVNGSTYIGDYPFDDEGGAGALEIVGDLNDHYFETSIGIPLRAVVEIDTTGGPDSYQSFEIILESIS